MNDSLRKMLAEEQARGHYRVNEIFTSVQGEGRWTGKPATFIRLQGCDVGCPWCDTKYTWPAEKSQHKPLGVSMSPQEIMAQVNTKHIVITGGEPLLWNLDPILQRTLSSHFVQIETSGRNELMGLQLPTWVTWSPKKNLSYNAPETLKDLVREVKWVVDEELQWEVVLLTWDWYLRENLHPLFYLMPEGFPPRPEMIQKTLAWLEGPVARSQLMLERFRFGDRLHTRIGVR